MTGPHPRDLHQRTIDTATRNDERQYGQSLMGPLYDTQRGRKQGALHNNDVVDSMGPFELQDTSPLIELEETISQVVFDEAPINPNPYPDLYGSETPYNANQGDIDQIRD
jgi:hypothetical protein